MAVVTLCAMTDSIGVGELATGDTNFGSGGAGNFVQLDADRLANLLGLGPLACSGYVGLDAYSPSPANYSGSWTTITAGNAADKAPYGAGTALYPKWGTTASEIVSIPFDATFRYPTVVTEIVCIDKASSGNPSFRKNGAGGYTDVAETWQQDNKLFSFLVNTSGYVRGDTLDFRCANSGGNVHFMPIARRVWYQTPATATGLVVDHLGVSGSKLHDAVEGLSTTTGQPTGNTDRLAWFDPTKCRLGTGCVDHTPSLTIIENINDIPQHGNSTTYATDWTTASKRLSPLGPLIVLLPYKAYGGGSYPTADQDAFRSAAESAAAAFSPPGVVFNMATQFEKLGISDYAGMKAHGYLLDNSVDGLHPTQLLQNWIASPAQLLGCLQRALGYSRLAVYEVKGTQASRSFTAKRPAPSYVAAMPIAPVTV